MVWTHQLTGITIFRAGTSAAGLRVLLLTHCELIWHFICLCHLKSSLWLFGCPCIVTPYKEGVCSRIWRAYDERHVSAKSSETEMNFVCRVDKSSGHLGKVFVSTLSPPCFRELDVEVLCIYCAGLLIELSCTSSSSHSLYPPQRPLHSPVPFIFFPYTLSPTFPVGRVFI